MYGEQKQQILNCLIRIRSGCFKPGSRTSFSQVLGGPLRIYVQGRRSEISVWLWPTRHGVQAIPPKAVYGRLLPCMVVVRHVSVKSKRQNRLIKRSPYNNTLDLLITEDTKFGGKRPGPRQENSVFVARSSKVVVVFSRLPNLRGWVDSNR